MAADRESGAVYIVDAGSVIRKIDRDGIVTSVYASRMTIRAIAMDLDGMLLLCAAHGVYRLSGENLERIAGGEIPGFAGDGGQARDALLNAPADLFVAASGAIYVADRGNDRVRKLERE